MSKPATKTKILDDGLRYQSKAGGSPFIGSASFSVATMSCFLCGKHRQRASMKTRTFIGKAQAVCAPSCKEAAENEARNAVSAAS